MRHCVYYLARKHREGRWDAEAERNTRIEVLLISASKLCISSLEKIKGEPCCRARPPGLSRGLMGKDDSNPLPNGKSSAWRTRSPVLESCSSKPAYSWRRRRRMRAEMRGKTFCRFQFDARIVLTSNNIRRRPVSLPSFPPTSCSDCSSFFRSVISTTTTATRLTVPDFNPVAGFRPCGEHKRKFEIRNRLSGGQHASNF